MVGKDTRVLSIRRAAARSGRKARFSVLSQSRRSLTRISLLVTLAVLQAPGTPAAQSPEDPTLARSELVVPRRAPAGEPIAVAMVVRSTSDEPVDVSVSAEMGDRFLFGGAAEGADVRFDPGERRVSWRGTIPARGDRRVEFSVVAPRWMYGSGLQLTVAAARDGESLAVHRTETVEVGEARGSRPGWGVRVGPVIVGPYECVLLGALCVSIGLWVWLRRRVAGLPMAAGLAAGGAVAVFATLTIGGLFAVDGTRTLVTDIAMLRSWEPVSCTVVDAVAAYEPPASGGRGTKARSGSYAPQAVTRYRSGRTWVTALGFWSDSHIFVSRRAERLVAPYRSGTITTCFVDPDRPDRFVLDRTPGFGHLVLVAILALGAAAVWLAIRLRRRPGPTEPA
ncbi:MAG TPA: DUF3592 domain-containing protein [Vicinamibacterales bacterium]